MTRDNNKYYKQFASDLYTMLCCFEEAGFTKEQAFELVSTYCRSSCVEEYFNRTRTQRLRDLADYHTNMVTEEEKND